MTMEAMTVLTFCDGERRETPTSPVVLTRWEIALLGLALRWPLADAETDARGGALLAAAARHYPRSGRRMPHLVTPDGDAWAPAEHHDSDDSDSGYWLDAAQVRRLYANLSDPATRETILAVAARTQHPEPQPDRLIVCLQMLAQAVRRDVGVHFAHYLC